MSIFRMLKADEIDVRIANIKPNGAKLLLYKDARVDQNILDECFGMFGWKRSHELIGDRLYCTVSIKDPDTGEWISKQDVGTESYTEKEKGQASDSFKRACFNWGIGRELYTAPFIWVSADKMNIENGKTYDNFAVSKIEYRGNKIAKLEIINTSKNNIVIFSWEMPQIREELFEKLTAEMERTGVTAEKIAETCKVESIEALNAELITKMLHKLAKTPDKEINENNNTDSTENKKE